MKRKKAVIVGAFVVVVVLAFAFLQKPSAGMVKEFSVFRDHRALFEDVINKVQDLAEEGKLDGDGNLRFLIGEVNEPGLAHSGTIGGYELLFSHGRFHQAVGDDLQSLILRISELSDRQLETVKYRELDGEFLIDFVFNWEQPSRRKPTFHIIYCKNEEAVISELGLLDEERNLRKLYILDVHWHGIIFRHSSFF